jgi:hypothetical protein
MSIIYGACIIFAEIGIMAFIVFVYGIVSLCLPDADGKEEDIIHVDESYVGLDQSVDVVVGHGKLVLIPGNEYEIHYGIHQGRYVYVGRKMDDNDLPEDYRANHMFRPVDSNEITFSYYGHTSPYEFTSIVTKIS